jgi:hypothetical protein
MFNMQARKLTFIVGYIHILTFKDQIKRIVAPYFTYDIEYGIDNEGTMQENVRLVFKKEGFIMQFNKEMSSLVYEGPIENVRKSNPHVDIFFDILGKIAKMETFNNIKYINMGVDFVGLIKKDEYEQLLVSNKFVYNPFQKFDEFATIMEFHNGNKTYRIEFGNFNEGDIEKRALSPLKTLYNKELVGKYGVMAQTRINEESNSASFSKFKDLLTDVTNVLHKYIA